MIHLKASQSNSLNRLSLLLLLSFLFLAITSSFAQIGIGTTTPDASTVLDVVATDKGLLIPRVSLTNVTTTMLDGTTTAATGLLIYNTNAAVIGGDGVGYYSFNGTIWEKLITSSTPINTNAFSTTANVTSNAPGNYANDDFLFGAPQLDFNGNLDHYKRMFFEKSKGAFRAGSAWGTSWDDSNVGNLSTVLGSGTASGTLSFAATGGIASGGRSVAFGIGSTAPSYLEYVIGRYNTIYTPNRINEWDSDDRLFVIGNGFGGGGARKDGLILFKNGNFLLGSSQLDDDGITYTDMRLFYNNFKSAFRSGRAGESQWDDINVGIRSTAFGNNTVASGFNTFAAGHNTNAPSYNETVFGAFNTIYIPSSVNTWQTQDRLFVIGNGTGVGAENDAFTVFKNGRININNEYYLPLMDGNANQLLQTNGTGNTNWVNSSTVGTDDQNISGSGLSGTTLTIGIENGTSETINLSSLQDGIGTDDQTLSYNSSTGQLDIEDGNSISLAIGDITGVTAGTGLTGGGTTGTVTLNVIAENGLTTNANNIVLGGTLTQATTITQDANNYIHNLNSSGDFKVQDNGVDVFEVGSNGSSYFGGDTYWKDLNTGGINLAALTDDGDDGRFILYEDGSASIDLDANTGFVFNEQGLDRNFRIEGETNTNLFYLDAGNDVVSFGRNNPTLTGNGLVVNGTTLDFVADFELSTGGTTIGLGSAEYVADVGGNMLAFSASLLPHNDNTNDLGSATLRWDDVYATNGTIQTSDIRDKKNIAQITYGLKELLALNPIRFQWKNSYDQKTKLGFSAQQLLEVIPEVVKDYDYEFPENGSLPIKKQNERLGVYYSDIIPVAVKAIQEQQKIIDSQQKTIQELEKSQNENKVVLQQLLNRIEGLEGKN